MHNFTFTSQAVTVKVMTTVTFANDDDIPSRLMANDGSFRSAARDTNDKYSLSVTSAGDFPCCRGLHPPMQGTIKVTP